MSLACSSELVGIRGDLLASALRVRDLRPGEEEPLLEIFAGLGPHSRELRFLAPKTRLTSADLRQLTDVDGYDHVAVVAETRRDGCPVGIARFVRDRDDPSTADVAVTVVDGCQRRGVGTFLSTALAERAQEVGIRRLTMAMLVENDGATRLLHRMTGRIERLEIGQGVAEFAITLAEPASGPWRPRLLKGGSR